MSKQIKQMQMDALKQTFGDVRDMVVMSVTKINATLDNQLRHNLRKQKIRLHVVKNSLTRRVFDEIGIKVGEESPYWKGNSVLAWGAGSVSELSRAIEAELKGKQAAQLKDKLTVKGAIVDGLPVTFDQALKMPTRLEAIGRIVMLALSPAGRIASQLRAPGGKVAGQIKTLRERIEEGDSEAAATPVVP